MVGVGWAVLTAGVYVAGVRVVMVNAMISDYMYGV